MLKKAVLFVISSLFVVTLVGCSASKPGDAKAGKEINIGEVVEQIMKDVEFAESGEMEEDMIFDFYEIDKDLIAEVAVARSLWDTNADELAIFKLKDAKDMDKVESTLKARQAQLLERWQDYIPEQAENVKNYALVKQGKYIMFVICQDSEKAKATFEAAFK
jgi:hypothetical protein